MAIIYKLFPVFYYVEYSKCFLCSAEYVEVEREGKVELYPVSYPVKSQGYRSCTLFVVRN